MARKIIVTVGLGFGDEGKGSIVDFLAYKHRAVTVVRYNGGPQAGHNVIDPDGRHHMFAQFGSGIFAGAGTHISMGAFVNLLNLEAEAEELAKKGVENPFDLITLNPHSLLITPFHIHVNQMREIARGRMRKGSCGKGVGEAARDAWNHVGLSIWDIFDPQVLRKKLDFLWRYKLDHAQQIFAENQHKQIAALLNRLAKENYVELLAEAYEKIIAKHRLKFKAIRRVLNDTRGTVIFEGAQGVLLDERYGFYPHITCSRTTCAYADGDISGSKAKVKRLGILRAYATRHGAGPFITEDRALAREIPDIHNVTNRWQGRFRIGWLDLVATRYALGVAGKIDSLAVTNLDRLSGMETIKVCTAYEYTGKDTGDLHDYFHCRRQRGKIKIDAIKIPSKPQKKNSRLTELLSFCRPCKWKVFKGWELKNKVKLAKNLPKEMLCYLEYLESPAGLGIPISIVSLGPTRKDKFILDKKRKIG